MIFGIILLALVIAVAMFHYVQGMFSAMISASLTIFAALIAISYHEPIAEKVFLSQFPNAAHAVSLIGLFAISYVFMRLITDKLVSGNVRMPVTIDKIGAGFFGLVAGIFAVGIFAIAAQMLPFGPSIAGYARFSVDDRPVHGIHASGYNRPQDMEIYSELKSDSLDPSRASGAFPIPVDDMTVGLAYYVSNGGSLEGSQPLASIHPSYLDELFCQRLITVGEKRVLPITGSNDAGIRVSNVFTSTYLLQTVEDFESKELRGESAPSVPPLEGLTPIAVRAGFSGPYGEVPFTMASVGLVLPVNGTFKELHPIGSYQGNRLVLTRQDDPLFSNKAMDLVFLVPTEALQAGDSGNQKKMPAGAILQFKRTGRDDLSGKAITDSIPEGGGPGFREKDRKPTF